jgi:hypothetical protein
VPEPVDGEAKDRGRVRTRIEDEVPHDDDAADPSAMPFLSDVHANAFSPPPSSPPLRD